MQAYVLEKGQLIMKEMELPQPKQDEVVVKVKVAGLNRRDLYIPERVGHEQEALIIGSDAAGIVEAVGGGVSKFKVGDEVLINPSLGWFENTAVPPNEFEILGMPDHGTLAEKVVISEEQLAFKPKFLSWEEAGVLSLAALTGYRALFTKGQLEKEQTVLIPGAGSGVNTYIIQFAKAVGARVIVTSRDKFKRKKALELGADLAIDTNSNWEKELAYETIDLVIDSIGRATFNKSLNVLKRGGKLVVFGATTEDIVQFDLRKFFYGQYQLLGSTMGSREEYLAMLAFIEKHKIKSFVGHRYLFKDVKAAFELLRFNNQFGKIAIIL